MLNLGVVTNKLEQHGGAEIYLLECMRRWQEVADITLYAPRINENLLEEHGVDVGRLQQFILTDFDEDDRNFDLMEDVLILPRLWEQDLQAHDVYFLNGFPLHFIRCFPSVYMCHEPLRMLYDLRYQYAVNDGTASVHIYPEQRYRHASIRRLEVQLELIESFDRHAEFDQLVVNSKATSEYVQNVYGRHTDLVAYPGINLQEQVSEPAKGKRAIYVGRLWKHKRINLLIQAIALLEEGALDIVGQGPEREVLEKLAEDLGVSERVAFHGGLSNQQVAALYQQATCGAYVPVREPFGMMPLEAAAAGRPVVVVPEGGYSEILDANSALFVYPKPPAIARAMRRLFENPELARRMGRQARAQVSSITWDKTADNIMQLIQRAADRRKKVSQVHDRPVVGAHYYPWYDAGRPMRHWNENTTFAAVVDLPLKGAYTSTDEQTINRHLDLAEHAGLDFFTINWEVGHAGVNARDLEATERLFAAAARHPSGLALTLILSIHTSLLEPVEQALELARHYAKEATWLKLRKRPVLWFFISSDFFGNYFAHKAELEQMCDGFAVLATGAVTVPHYLPIDVLEFIEGWCLFAPFRVGDSENWEEKWRSTYRHHTTEGGDPYRIFTVSPGYDDRHLSSGEHERTGLRLVEREGGAIYERMLSCARGLDPAPEIIMITSFNEYHETTQIEPSFMTGDLYLEQTRSFTRALSKAKKKEDEE